MTDATMMTIRTSPAVRDRLNRAARARGLSQPAYIERLLDLHDAMRALADTPTSDGRWVQVATELKSLGLQTVSA